MQTALAFFRLCQVVGDSERHQHYPRTVEYAKKCKALVTGEEIDPLIQQFTRRESEEDYKQRKRLTFITTTGLLSRIKRNFSKALRNDEVKVSFLIGEKELEEEKVDLINDNFYQDQTLKKYLNLYALDMNWCDPNAWLLIDFKSFDSDVEKPRPFPVIVPSSKALDFYEDYEGLHYLAREHEKGFAIHTSEEIVDFKRTSSTAGAINYSDKRKLWKQGVEEQGENWEMPLEAGSIIQFGQDYYEVLIHTPEVNRIQARRFGYNHDTFTANKTYVTPWHAGMNRIMGLVKSMSEFNLSTTLHAFPQKVIRTIECKGEQTEKGVQKCNRGLIKGDDGLDRHCNACNGRGAVVSTSAQEAIEVPMRNNDTGQDIVPLKEMQAYLDLPIDIIEFLYDFINKEGVEVLRDIFPSIQFGEKAAMKTATEVTVDYEAVNDVVFDFATQYSRLFEFSSTVVGTIQDNANLEVKHKFPSDLQLKSISDLTVEYNATKDAPPIVRKVISLQIIKKLHGEDGQMLERERFKIQADLLAGVSVSHLAAAGEYVDELDKFIHYNTEKIMRECEKDNKDFNLIEYSARMEAFRKKAQELAPSRTIAPIEE